MITAVANTQNASVRLFEEFSDEARYNILRPTDSVLIPSPLHLVYANVVHFTTDDTYPVDGGRLALNGRALARIAAAAGISIVNTVRQDDGSNPDYAEVSILAMMKRPDGSFIHATGKKAVDVSAYIAQQIASQKAKPADKRKSDAQIQADAERDRLQLRKFRVERAETGAKNRAIRQLLAMKAAYSREDLAKPFVIPQIQPNMQAICADEYGRRLAIQQALGGLQQMYGGMHDLGMPAGNATAPQLAAPADGADAHTAPSPAAAIATDDSLPDIRTSDTEAADIAATLRSEFARREHSKSEAALEKMLAEPTEKQRAYIDWLVGLPLRPAPATDNWHASEAQIKRLYAIAKANEFDGVALHELISERFNGITSLNDLTRAQYDELCGDEKSNTPSWLATHPKTGGNDELPF